MKLTSKRLGLLALACGVVAASDAAESPRPLAVENVVEHRNVRYLPDWRYPEQGEQRRATQMVMDIAVPDDGKTEHPVLFVVHGGGWSAGTKDEAGYRKIMAYFVERGYVCVGFNYMLRPRGVFPQIFWDLETAIRFLRKNAAEYKVDPTRIGAIGLSAGGWLISSVGHATGDLVLANHKQSRHLGELWERNWQVPDDDWEDSFLRPMVNPGPEHPDEYGRLQAISMDFHFRIEHGSGNSPAMNNWMGEGGKMHDHQEQAARSGKFDYTETLWVHPKFKGKSVHVPPLFKNIRSGGNESEVIGFDGERSDEGIEQVYRFFQHHLVENARTPVPEFRPTSRFFDDETKVAFVMPKMDYEIRYQVVPLASEKGRRWYETYPPVKDDAWKAWAKYDAPFSIRRDSLVRAVAVSEGRRPSTIAEAHYFKGVASPPRVISPDGDTLPPGRTGEPYEVKFEADVESPRWFLAGDLVPWQHKGQHYPNNMLLDRNTGKWSGTPTKPGKYWLQIWVNDANGKIAGYRDYTWIVEGKDLAADVDLFQTPPVDPFVEVVYLPTSNIRASRLADPLRHAGIRYSLQDDKHGTMILVDQGDAAQARQFIATKLKEWKHDGEAQWRAASP